MNTYPSMRSCIHTRLANGIYEFAFLDNSRRAVDEHVTLLEQYVSGTVPLEKINSSVGILVELRTAGMPPVAYLANSVRALLVKHKRPLPNIRVVFLYQSGVLLSIAQTFSKFVPGTHSIQTRFHHVSERADAETWLQE